ACAAPRGRPHAGRAGPPYGHPSPEHRARGGRAPHAVARDARAPRCCDRRPHDARPRRRVIASGGGVLEIDPLRDGVTPAPAATVIVVRDASGGPEVLLVQRHRATAFMGGAFVFPGGRVEASDGDDALVARVSGLDAATASA